MRLKSSYKFILFSLLFSCLFLSILPFVNAGANEGDYFLNMENISQRLKHGNATFAILGDSITANTQSPRIPDGIIRKWKPDNWKGIGQPMVAGLSGGGGSAINAPSTSLGQLQSMGYGDNYTNFSSYAGWVTSGTSFFNFTLDSGYMVMYGFGVASWAPQTYGSGENTYDWTANANVTARFIYLTSPGGVNVSASSLNRNGTNGQASKDPISTYSPTINLSWTDLNFISGVGATGSIQGSGMILNTKGGAYNDSGKVYLPVGWRMFSPNATNGMEMNYIGRGGFTTLDHLNETKLTNYSIFRNMQAFDYNTFMIWLGQNSAGDEWNGNNIGNYEENIKNIIRRYTAIYNQTGKSDTLQFILVSTYDGSATNEKWVLMESALKNITKNQNNISGIAGQAEIGFVALRSILNDTNGSYSAWQATYTSDGIHPNALGANWTAELLWNEVENAVSTPNGTINNISWQSNSYLVQNVSLSSSSALFNNSGVFNSSLRVYNLTDALMFYGNLTLIADSNISANDDNINITIITGENVTILNNYSLLENSPRNESPIWISLSTSTSKRIASNLSSPVNITATFNVDSCDLSTVTYYSDTGVFNKTYSSTEYTCSNGNLTIPLYQVETATGSNVLAITYVTASEGTPSTSNLGPGYSSETSVSNGVQKTIYRNEPFAFVLSSTPHTLKITNIKNGVATITIRSNPITFTLSPGEEKKINLSSSDSYDLLVRLVSLSNYYGKVYIQKIDEPFPQEQPLPQIDENNSAPQNFNEEEKSSISSIFFPLILIVILFIIIILYFVTKKRKQ